MNVQAYFTPALKAFHARTAREQLLLAGLGLIVVLMAIWFGLLAPAIDGRAEATRRYVSAVEGYETILDQTARYRALAASTAPEAEREPLRTLADRSARERGLSISRVQPLEDGRLGVWMEDADADALMAWLAALSTEQGVNVERASLDRSGDNRVRAQLTLMRAGGAS